MLLTCCLPNTVYYLAKTPNCINALASIAATATTSDDGNSTISVRQQALKALCYLATDDRSAPYFYDNKSWLHLLSSSSSVDNESLYLICLLCSLLQQTPVASILPPQQLSHLCQLLSSATTITVSVIAFHEVDSSMSLLCTSTLLKLCAGNTDLPGTLLLQIYRNMLRFLVHGFLFG